MAPYKKFYDIACEFLTNYENWTEAMIGSYDPEVIESETVNAYRLLYKLEKTFQEPAVKKLAEIVRIKIEDFKEHIPVILTLGNPTLKSRHWEQISEIVGFPIKVDQYMTLAKVKANLTSLSLATDHNRIYVSVDSRLWSRRLCREI